MALELKPTRSIFVIIMISNDFTSRIRKICVDLDVSIKIFEWHRFQKAFFGPLNIFLTVVKN